VGRQTGRREAAGGLLVERGGGVLLRQHQLAAPPGAVERRALLDGELVERDMLWAERQGGIELLTPGCRRLSRTRIDKVEGDARKGSARQLERRERLGGRVLPAQKF